ncbi:uncharacterized protein LOC122313811 isoform X1 [Carya illinoinensis]|uniref:uncharacterized protein LOC122313811 isoform X1 n=1 Tax=Carya illinoinensis TaxID=32201 RepID=UPI001C72541D|nr:uncharacterized protein LOC122313811 isoform X1 [Carya illinoinensis]
MNKIHALLDTYILDRWRKDLNRRYTIVKSSYDDLRQNVDSRRYEFVVKQCLTWATHVCPSDDHVIAFMCHLDEFENKFKGLTLEFGSSKVKETMVMDKGKKILGPHIVRGKGRPPMKMKVLPVEKTATKRKKKPTCRKIFDDASQDGEVLEAPETDKISCDVPAVLKALEEIGSQLRKNPPQQVISISPSYNYTAIRPPQPFLDPTSGIWWER